MIRCLKLRLTLILGLTIAKGALVQVDLNDDSAVPFRHFWSSTGFAPPEGEDANNFYLSEDVLKNLAIIGSLPKGAINQVRIHWLLDLIRMRDPVSDPFDLDMTNLDTLIHHLWDYDLKPGFEMMGNPSNYFKDLENPVEIMVWRAMVEAIAGHFVHRYGGKEVEQWNFESWNEPDHHDFGGINFTRDGFLAYYDSTSMGLKAGGGVKLRFGGPAGACREPKFTELCMALLEHCLNGTNYWTGEAGSRLDFISFHKKGEEDVDSIISNELALVRQIRQRYPPMADKPFLNDEGDPMKSWWKRRQWRGDATYASLVASHIIRTQARVIEEANVNMTLLSNDNAFLNVPPDHFDQRTLLARFFDIGQTDHGQFVQKPIFNLMAMLALLGDEKVKAISNSSADVEVLGTKTQQAISVLLVRSGNKDHKIRVNVTLPALEREDLKAGRFCWFKLTNGKTTNPRKVWKRLGRPTTPDPEQMRAMRRAAMLIASSPRPVDGNHFEIDLPRPGVALLQICFLTGGEDDTLSQPTRIRVYPARTREAAILITWRYSGPATCLRGYSVEVKTVQGTTFKQVNAGLEQIVSFWHLSTDILDADSWIRVQVKDVWGRSGPYSVPEKIPYRPQDLL